MIQSKFCGDCGAKPVALCDGRAVCVKCLIQAIRSYHDRRVTALDGGVYELDACPVCETTREALLKSGYLGCPACYSAFSATVREQVEASTPSGRRRESPNCAS